MGPRGEQESHVRTPAYRQYPRRALPVPRGCPRGRDSRTAAPPCFLDPPRKVVTVSVRTEEITGNLRHRQLTQLHTRREKALRMTSLPDPEALVQRESDLVDILSMGRRPWQLQSGQRGRTPSKESFHYALTMPDAPVALAMLRAYITAVGLDQSDDWSISAMPRWSGTTGHQRFATVSGGGIELFFVTFESASGLVAEWGARFPPDLAPHALDPDLVWLDAADNGDTLVLGENLESFLAVLDDPGFRTAITATCAARATSRRADWHNPYLGTYLGATGALSAEEAEPTTDADIEFERRYIERVTRSRLHQAPLRSAALRHYTAACHYCGLDVPQILDVAHIEPDSEGGAASVANVRLLCANHHRAFDRGLLIWEPQQELFTQAPESRAVPPIPQR